MSKELSNAIIRNPYVKMSMTEEHIIEFARCADPVTGPKYFMSNYFYIQHPTQGSLRYTPFEYQDRLIDTYHTNRFSINLMPRQTGKSTTAAGYLLWYAMFVPDSTILIAAHKYAGSQEIMQRIRYAYENCPDFIRAGVTSYNKGSLDFENGSRIVSATTTENTGRGMSISLLYCDEFAFVRPTIAQEFWTSITPTLSTGGKCIITSTPNSDEDQFAQIWRAANDTFDKNGNETPLGRNGFKAFRSKWQEHPERGPDYAEQMRQQLGEERFRREIECEFIIFDETLINPIFLSEMAGIDPIEKLGQVRWYKKPTKSNMYTVALDPSLGTGGNPSAIQIVELPSMMQVGEWRDNKTPIQKQVKILQEITQYIHECIGVETDIYYSVENNSLGEAALVEIFHVGEENIRGIFLSEQKKPGASNVYRKGFNTTNKGKIAACSKMKHWIETRKLKVASKMLVSELKNFIAKGISYEAKIGETDDLVSAMLLTVRMMQAIQSFDPMVDDTIRSEDEEVLPLPFIVG